MTTLFGIRHHGPGCARSLLVALADLAPDVILLEMPQELEPLLGHAAHESMKPPVAMMLYRTDLPVQSSFYPFAEFSPEWNAIRWAIGNKVPIRCFDLPAAHLLALRETEDVTPPRPDAFEWLAQADGYSDGERWWNDRVEERRDPKDFFEAIRVAVIELRRELALEESRETLMREAWMRKCLRQAEKDGFTNIAVICGAWHVPALEGAYKVSDDNALLKGLEKHKAAATWIPWTDERLTYTSGYGAGVRSPGWYRHLWKNPGDPIPVWLTKAARILRGEGQEASSASVIEAVRLANSLAGLRGRPLPGLDETLQAMQSVFCQGDALPLDLLNKKLLIGDRLGELPADLPALPLQQDIEASIRRLRLKMTASFSSLELDLREDGGLARSVFLHRLLALGIDWGQKQQARSKGTFKEVWRMKWSPDLVVAIIDASAYGNTVESAATARLTKTLTAGESIAAITSRLDLALLGDLPAAVGHLLQSLDAAAATSHDIEELLEAVPSLAQISRYGNVRATDSVAVGHLLAGFAARIHAGLVVATSGISEEAADPLMRLIAAYSSALAILEDGALADDFRKTLAKMIAAELVHPKLRGHAVRLLRDASYLDDDAVARHFSFALSPGMPALAAACWLEGFLHGGGSLLVYDPSLLHLVDAWLSSLSDDGFQSILPLLRRTFGTFTYPERAKIAGAVATAGNAPTPVPIAHLNLMRALPALQTVARLLFHPSS
jgi:hypothetical protein